MEENQNFNNFQEESIDIKKIIFMALSYWKLFVLSIFTTVAAAYFFNTYADPDYEAQSKVLIMTDNQDINPFNPASMFKQPVNIENEMAILHSYDITRKAMQTMDWQVSYFRYGQIRTNQMFDNNPYTVVIDTSHLQAVGVKFDVVIISDKEYRLMVSPIQRILLYDFRTENK